MRSTTFLRVENITVALRAGGFAFLLAGSGLPLQAVGAATVCVRNQCQAPSPDAGAPGGAATVTASPGGCNCGGSSALLAGMLVVPVALRRRQPGVAR